MKSVDSLDRSLKAKKFALTGGVHWEIGIRRELALRVKILQASAPNAVTALKIFQRRQTKQSPNSARAKAANKFSRS